MPGSTRLPPDVQVIFEKLHKLLESDAEQNNTLPEPFKSQPQLRCTPECARRLRAHAIEPNTHQRSAWRSHLSFKAAHERGKSGLVPPGAR